MNSEFHGSAVLLTLLLILNGCTEHLPIDPIYSDDTNWTPAVALAHNDYQRIELFIERPPRKELLRNILWYEVQLQGGASADYQRLDSIPAMFIQPPYLTVGYSSLGQFPFAYSSKPTLDFQRAYSTRLVIHFRPGITRISEAIPFTTPSDRGKILKRFSFPTKATTTSEWENTRIAMHKGNLIVLRDTELWKVDTASGQSTLLIRELQPPPDNRDFMFRSISVAGDSLITYYADQDFQIFTLVIINLNTLQADSTLRMHSSGKTLYQVKSDGFQLLTLWYDLSTNTLQFATADLYSGAVNRMFNDGPSIIAYPYAYCYAGGSWWQLVQRDFDNRIVRFDPASLTVLEDHPHPIFSPYELAWDGANFWSVDRETRSIVKFLLR